MGMLERMVASQGFEPRPPGSEPGVLPLNELALLGNRDSNPAHLIQSQAFCPLNYSPLLAPLARLERAAWWFEATCSLPFELQRRVGTVAGFEPAFCTV